METSKLEIADWLRATSLRERIACPFTASKPPGRQRDDDAARRRLTQWQEQAPFSNGDCFSRRLTTDGLTEDGLLELLGEPSKVLRERFHNVPKWLKDISDAFSDARPSTAQIQSPVNESHQDGFLWAVQPFIRQARQRVDDWMETSSRSRPDLPFDANGAVDALFADVPQRLSQMLTRTLILELHVARLQGLLRGETPEERFNSFLLMLRDRNMALAMFKEYPVLARQIAVTLDQWSSFCLEFVSRLCADWERIKIAFHQRTDLRGLVSIESGLGDKHRGGQSVLAATFESGLKLVYKPRSMAVDVHFQQLLSWINARNVLPPFRTLKVLDRGTHGWEEYVAASSCIDSDQVRRFYERQGGYLALLYALNASDFHFENLVAAGEHPVLIDVESLFQPNLPDSDLNQADRPETMTTSLLDIGLLPRLIWENPDSSGVDVSGLGAAEGQMTPYQLPCVEGVGTDQMRLARKSVELPRGVHRPTMNGCGVDLGDYEHAIAHGFSQVYRLLQSQRDDLLSDTGPLNCFVDDEVRVFLRQTFAYDQLLHESYHPDLLRDGLDRDRLFDRLWSGVDSRPYLADVIGAERDDLWQGDIPVFTTRPGSRDLTSSSGLRITDYFKESGMSVASRRLRELSEDDLKKQLARIRASLTTTRKHCRRRHAAATQGPSPSCCEYNSEANFDRNRLLRGAELVGIRLSEMAVRGDGDVTWLGWRPISAKQSSLAPIGIDLYSGLSGMVLFLAEIGAVLSERSYTNLARSALKTLRRRIPRDTARLRSIGAFEGWGGVIYALARLGILWEESELLSEAERLTKTLPPLIEADVQMDIVGGASGCIRALMMLHKCFPSDHILEIACKCGDQLLNRAQVSENGTGWIAGHSTKTPLTGFAHGTAGVASALLELWSVTAQERFKNTALDAIRYERNLFSTPQRNWPDLRPGVQEANPACNKTQRFTTAWCHGAPGIGLARLSTLRIHDDAATRSEIDIALATTLAGGFIGNHSLCHGDLGNLELVLQASEMFDDERLRGTLNRRTATILDGIEEHGWLCGVPTGVETPGLMVGLAGIGYELLRLAAPGRVPSVLTLEPPRIGSPPMELRSARYPDDGQEYANGNIRRISSRLAGNLNHSSC